MRKELLNGLTKEQIAKAKACKNQSELKKLAQEEGIELSDEQLSAVNGGCDTWERKCPYCGSTDFEALITKKSYFNEPGSTYKCNKCHKVWTES